MASNGKANGRSPPMPFDFYLSESTVPQPHSLSQASSDGSPTTGPRLQVQIPSMLPTLAHGGGAEALPLVMFASPYSSHPHAYAHSSSAGPNSAADGAMTMGDAWMLHNGFDNMAFVGQHHPHQYHPLYSNPSAKSDSASSSSGPSHSPHSQTRSPIYTNTSYSSPSITSGSSQASSYPMYSTSGIDLMSLLARVSTRKDKTVELGPVDDSCSFVVCDIRRYDSPIIYCSQSFCELTGYSSKEVIGRNCRFLQAPPGITLTKGAPRPHSSEAEIQRMAKMLEANKECQAEFINYRKDGSQFINLVTVIPVVGGGGGQDEDKICFHVGFQIDRGAVPGKIIQELEAGRWVGTHVVSPYSPPAEARKSTSATAPAADSPTQPSASLPSGRPANKIIQIPPQAIHDDLRRDSQWLQRLLDSKAGRDPTTPAADMNLETLLDHVLLEMSPDIVWVVSLKGTFLYVSPSVKRVLGYEPEELVNKGLGDLCHPKDLVPLLRELKESCSFGDGGREDEGLVDAGKEPKVVDLMFRALSKSSKYVWLHSRGRLHMEPGKGRKAIILSARAREMSSLALPLSDILSSPSGKDECWGTMSKEGIVLHIGDTARDLLGVERTEIVGKKVFGPTSIVCQGTEELEAALRDVYEIMRLSRLGQAVHLAPRHVVVQVASRLPGTSAARGVMHGLMSLYPVASSSPAKVEGFASMEESVPMDVDSPPSGGHETGVSVATESSNVVSPPSIVFRISVTDLSHGGLIQHHPHRQPTPQDASTMVNMYEELSVTRGTSWQYELQQLRFANERLKEEIKMMEGMLDTSPSQENARPSTSSMSGSTTVWQQPSSYYAYGALGGDYGYGPPVGVGGAPGSSSSAGINVSVGSLGTTLSSLMPQTPGVSGGTKRRWDVMDGGGG